MQLGRKEALSYMYNLDIAIFCAWLYNECMVTAYVNKSLPSCDHARRQASPDLVPSHMQGSAKYTYSYSDISMNISAG